MRGLLSEAVKVRYGLIYMSNIVKKILRNIRHLTQTLHQKYFPPVLKIWFGSERPSSTQHKLLDPIRREVRSTLPESTEENLRMYLLGSLRGKRREKVERQIFEKDEYYEQLHLLEDELIDEYLYGHLSRREENLFKKNFMLSKTRKEKLDFAKKLKENLDYLAGKRVDRSLKEIQNMLEFIELLSLKDHPQNEYAWNEFHRRYDDFIYDRALSLFSRQTKDMAVAHEKAKNTITEVVACLTWNDFQFLKDIKNSRWVESFAEKEPFKWWLRLLTNDISRSGLSSSNTDNVIKRLHAELKRKK